MTTLRDKLYAERQLNKHAFGNRPSVSRIVDVPTYNDDPTTEMEPINKQNYFTLLNQVGDSQFQKVILIGLLNIVIIGVFVAILFSLFFLNHKDPHTPPDNLSTAVSLGSTVSAHTTNTTLLIPTTSAPTTFATTISAPTTRTDTTTHSPSSDTTTYPFDHTDCSPNHKSTFFFAYSNDLTADQVLNTWTSISNNTNFFFETYALGRFDNMYSRLNETFSTFDSSDSFDDITDALLSNLPNPADSFNDPSRGGTVLGIIDSFFCSDVIHCGATLFILTKRFPTETSSYIDYLVSLLKKYHSYITFVVSENSLGGLSPESMYKLASETNGLCIFTGDDKIQETPFWLPSIWPSYLVYSVNAEVTRSGTLTLPVFNAPLLGKYHISMTLQDHGPLDTFRMVHLTWYNAGTPNSGSFEETLESHAGYGNTTYIMKGPFTLYADPYNMALEFEYSDNKINILQIRIYSVSAVDFWVPYNN
ncbi:hypothetical protein CRE_30189 [Caenorhabditis remanei]|uniref:DUF7154 domain-containing protein n=1 Tax=Caenorhabditis remanei TaxID=31234 RepID=E3NGL1_CAERE|nr:hypothetical protein CRE_30189 [Caenorhabditis remanei]